MIRIFYLLAFFFLAKNLAAQNLSLPWQELTPLPCLTHELATQNGVLFAATDCGLFKSFDQGENWERQADVPALPVKSVVASDSVVLAFLIKTNYGVNYASVQHPIFRSTDKGATFSQVLEFQGYSCSYNAPHGCAGFEPSEFYRLDDSTFFIEIKTAHYSSGFRHLRSKDFGATWQWHHSFKSSMSSGTSIQLLAFGQDTIFYFWSDTLFVSTDGDSLAELQKQPAVWSCPTTGWDSSLPPYRKLIKMGNWLHIFTAKGEVLSTSNYGQTWSSQCLPEVLKTTKHIFQQDSFAYFSTEQGLFRATQFQLDQLDTIYASPPPLDKVRLAASFGNDLFLLNANVLQRSQDAGATWEKKYEGLGGYPLFATYAQTTKRFYPLDDRLLLSDASDPYHPLWFFSQDQGQHWHVWQNQQVYQLGLTYFSEINGVWFAFKDFYQSTRTLFRSNDHGENWLPVIEVSDNVNIADAWKQFVSTGDTLLLQNFFSIDTGATWQPLPNGFDGIVILAEDDTLCAYQAQVGYRLSKDFGQTWTPGGGYIRVKNKLLSFPSYNYVQVSTDWGVTWSNSPQAFWSEIKQAQPVGGKLFVSTSYGGLWFTADGENWLTVSPNPASLLLPWLLASDPFFNGWFSEKNGTLYVSGKGIWQVPACEIFEAGYPVVTQASICLGSSYLFFGDTLTQSATYNHLTNHPDGCDTTFRLHLTVAAELTSEWSASICEGEVLNWNGASFSQNGTYLQTFSALGGGCDSLVYLHLIVLDSLTEMNVNLCAGKILVVGDTSFDASGDYLLTFQNSLGCDSSVLIHLIILPPNPYTISSTRCEGDAYIYKGQTFTQSGIYEVQWLTSGGCQAITTLTLTFHPADTVQVDTTLLPGELLHGKIVSADTSLAFLFDNQFGCDSLVIYQVDVLTATGEEQENEQAVIFPNPVRAVLQVQLPPGASERAVRIFSITGRVVLERKCQVSGELRLDVAGLAPGSYWLEVKEGDRWQAIGRFAKI